MVLSQRELVEALRQEIQERVQIIGIKDREDSAWRLRCQKWLNWSLGGVARLWNKNMGFFLVDKTFTIFICPVIFMGWPTVVACPESKGACYVTREFALKVNHGLGLLVHLA